VHKDEALPAGELVHPIRPSGALLSSETLWCCAAKPTHSSGAHSELTQWACTMTSDGWMMCVASGDAEAGSRVFIEGTSPSEAPPKVVPAPHAQLHIYAAGATNCQLL
jgi:hypothetical protein